MSQFFRKGGIALNDTEWIQDFADKRLQRCVEETGVWFGTSEPDDSKGALLYDTYVIEELKCDSNAGFKPVSYTHLDVYKRQEPGPFDAGINETSVKAARI